MNAQDLKNSILQLAIQGKLVEQRKEEGTAKELLEKIEAEKKQLIKEGKIKKQKELPEIKEDEIPFDIPDSWEWVRLIDLSLFIKAGGDKPKDFLKSKTETHEVPVIANGIQNDGIIGYTKEATVEESCITVSGRGTIGFSCLRTEPFTPVVRLLVIKISNQLDDKYVQNVLTALIERGVGTSIKQLTVPMIEPKLIPLPPLEEQQRIVAKIEELMPYVDKYDVAYSEVEKLNKKFPEDMQKSILQYAIQGKLVEQREEDGTAEDLYKQIQEEKKKLIKEGKIKKTKDLPEITEDEIPFDIPESWEWVRLADVSENIHYGYTASANAIGDCKLLRITDIQNNSVQWESVPYCNVKEKDYCTYGLNNRDIMIARTGGTIGKTYIVENLNDRAVFASYLIRVIPVNKVDEIYLKKFMESPLYWIQLKAGSMGTGQPNVNGTTLSKVVLPLPPLEEQKRIVERIEELLPYTKQLAKKPD